MKTNKQTPNFNFSHTSQLSNKVTNTRQCNHSMQLAITSERGHTNDWPGSISKGAGANTKSFPQKFVTRRFLEHGNLQPGNCIGHQSLETATVCPRSSTPSDGQANGIHGTHERPRPPTSLEKRL
jgi:hypothetical protein